MKMEIIKYDCQYEEKWDDFIQNTCINGTFLQERRFLNYHKEGRFEDASLLLINGEKILGVCPACAIYENDKKIFYSHPGSTYGGILVGKEMLRAEKIATLLDVFENYLQREHFDKCVLKPTMELLCQYPQGIMEFFLYHKGYTESKELNLYIDYSKYNEDVLSNFSKMKKRNIKKCIAGGFQLKELQSALEIEEFHKVLSANLLKYDLLPVHTTEELLDLKKRLPAEIEFYGAFLDGKLVAGTMVFVFEKTRCAHTQYLAADPNYKDTNAMAFIYYKMADMFYQRKFRYLSWGIATEHYGIEVNYNLANNKEEYGSIHNVINIFEKKVMPCE